MELPGDSFIGLSAASNAPTPGSATANYQAWGGRVTIRLYGEGGNDYLEGEAGTHRCMA